MRFTDARVTVLQLAQEVAQSGRYRGWRTIEAHLRADGLPRVHEVLDDTELRRELGRDCRAAQSNVRAASQ